MKMYVKMCTSCTNKDIHIYIAEYFYELELALADDTVVLNNTFV